MRETASRLHSMRREGRSGRQCDRRGSRSKIAVGVNAVARLDPYGYHQRRFAAARIDPNEAVRNDMRRRASRRYRRRCCRRCRRRGERQQLRRQAASGADGTAAVSGPRRLASVAGVGGGAVSPGRVRLLLRCPPAARVTGRGEDPLLQPLQRRRSARSRARRRASGAPAVCVERVRLAVGAVEREHLLPRSRSRSGCSPDESLQLTDQLLVAAELRGRSRSGPSARSDAALRAARPRCAPTDSSWSPASVGPRQSASASPEELGRASSSPSRDALARASASSLHVRRVELGPARCASR